MGGCSDCVGRVPWATLIATVLCVLGVTSFCVAMHRGANFSLRILNDVFRIDMNWYRKLQYTYNLRFEAAELTLLVVGAGMAGLWLMILLMGCLSTGATRASVYQSRRGRVGGRVSCAVFMGLTYVLVLVWLVVLMAMSVLTFMYTVAWMQCDTVPENQCIDYNQFGFMFPSNAREEDKKVCQGEKKNFCKDFVNNAEVMFIIATVGCFVVVISLIHYLVCLAANYAHIKDQEKFVDLQDLQYIREHSEMSSMPKERF